MEMCQIFVGKLAIFLETFLTCQEMSQIFSEMCQTSMAIALTFMDVFHRTCLETLLVFMVILLDFLEILMNMHFLMKTVKMGSKFPNEFLMLDRLSKIV